MKKTFVANFTAHIGANGIGNGAIQSEELEKYIQEHYTLIDIMRLCGGIEYGANRKIVCTVDPDEWVAVVKEGEVSYNDNYPIFKLIRWACGLSNTTIRENPAREYTIIGRKVGYNNEWNITIWFDKNN